MSAITTLTDEQLKLWHLYGSTDASALLGENPWATEIDVYRSHTEPREYNDSHHIKRGVFLERGLCEWAAHDLGMSLAPASTLTSCDYPLQRATPDGILDGNAPLEVKAPGPYTANEWNTDVDDETGVPPQYVIQAHCHMMCGEYDTTYVAALVFGELSIWRVGRDDQLVGVIAEAIERFHTEHVEPRVPPPPDGSAGYSAWLENQYRKPGGAELTANVEIVILLETMRAEQELAKKHNANATLAKQRLQSIMGEAGASKVAAPGIGRVSWYERKGSVAWKKAAEAAGVTKEQAEEFRGNSIRVMTTRWENQQ